MVQLSLKQKSQETIQRFFADILIYQLLLTKKKNYDYIKIKKINKINKINYNIPSDISSSAFFIVLVALTKNSQLTIKNVNINPSRIGVITILRKMGIKINFKNKKKNNGEDVSDIVITSPKFIKAIT